MKDITTNELRKKELCYQCRETEYFICNCTKGEQHMQEIVIKLEPKNKYNLAQIVASLPESAFNSSEGEGIHVCRMELMVGEEDDNVPPASELSFSLTKQ